MGSHHYLQTLLMGTEKALIPGKSQLGPDLLRGKTSIA
jgi:hypothetical protein